MYTERQYPSGRKQKLARKLHGRRRYSQTSKSYDPDAGALLDHHTRRAMEHDLPDDKFK